ncbi:DUF5990 family protein [Sphaerisporangium aureirubrum]|uniref:DUF5990 family protein n=1 Tax=Sphaerisporangium aureirubrum TaxID=1544736 RepID=A0ABW1NGE5_9ACTN
MQIRIEASDLPGRDCAQAPGFPGYSNIHVALQRRQPRDELLGMTAGDAPSAVWKLEVTATHIESGWDLRGPFVQGRPGARFLYLSWGTLNGAGTFTMFRRAKLWLDTIPPDLLDSAITTGLLVAHLGLTDPKGQPLCASVRPPLVKWSVPPS